MTEQIQNPIQVKFHFPQSAFNKAQVFFLAEKYIGKAEERTFGFSINDSKTRQNLTCTYLKNGNFRFDLSEWNEIDDGEGGSVCDIENWILADDIDATKACQFVVDFKF